MTGGLIAWPGDSIFFLCLMQQSWPKAWKPHFLHLQRGPVADHSDADSISCSALSLISCRCETRCDHIFFSRVMKRFDSAFCAFGESAFKKLPSTLFSLYLCYTVFEFSFWLACQTLRWHDFSVHYRASASFLEYLCNPYLMKALAKSTTEIKAVELVKPRPFGEL